MSRASALELGQWENRLCIRDTLRTAVAKSIQSVSIFEMADRLQDRLRTARERAGFKSAAAAARAHGWGDATYRHHENGTRSFDLKQAVKYAMAFDTNPRYLLGLDPAFDSFGLHDLFNNAIEPSNEASLRSSVIKLSRSLYGIEFVREIPFYADHGMAIDADFSKVRYHAFNSSLLASIDEKLIEGNAAAVVMQDASMGATAPIGSLLLIDIRRHRSRRPDALGVFHLDESLLIRRVKTSSDDGILVSADSPDVPDRFLEAGSYGSYGEVRWIGKPV